MSAKKKTTTAAEAHDVTVPMLANELNMPQKSLRRKLRAETRDVTNDVMHKTISRKTRYAFTRSEADAIVARFTKSA